MNKVTAKSLLVESANRIKLHGSFIAPQTKEQISNWNKKGTSIGVLIDRLTAFAISQNYNPSKPIKTNV